MMLEDQLMPEKSKKHIRQNRFSLIGVPAYVSGTNKTQIEQFYSKLTGYQMIFGANGLAHQLDSIICGVGVYDDSNSDLTGVFIKERIAQGETDEEELRQICAGDFGGVLLAKKAGCSKTAKLNKGWVGMDQNMLKKVASRARLGEGPGSIAIAQGKRKAEAVITAVRSELVSQLVVDVPLAKALKQFFKRKSAISEGR